MAVLIFLITSVVIVSEKLNRPVVALAGAALMVAFGVLTQEEALTSIDANTIALCDDLGLDARPFLITQVIASNIGGTATLIGDPPNILIGGATGLDFIAFLTNLGPLVLILLPLMIGGFWLMFGRGGRLGMPAPEAQRAVLEGGDHFADPRLLRISLFVLVLTILGFFLHGHCITRRGQGSSSGRSCFCC